MDEAILHQILRQAGVLDGALPDAVYRATAYFTREPSPEDIEAWCATLRQDAAHLFAAPPQHQGTPQGPDYSRLPTTDRLTAYRQANPPAPKPRHLPVPLSAAQLRELARLEPMARLARYRELQHQAVREQGP